MATPGYLPFHPHPSKPDLQLLSDACDAHCHVFGPDYRFPYSPASSYIPVDAPKEILFRRHQFLGISRGVIVQGSCHGADNGAMLDALHAGSDSYRGVAMLSPEISEARIAEMHEAGVRAVRFNFLKRLKAQQPEDARLKIIRKISRFSWHVVVYFEPEDLPEIYDFLMNIPTRVVIDHMGCVPVDKGVQSPEFQRLAQLLKDDRFWVKIASLERLSKKGPPYDDANKVAQELFRLAPDRVLWGTDWPHPNLTNHVPDDGMLVDNLAKICPDKAHLRALLVDNPTRLYWSVR